MNDLGHSLVETVLRAQTTLGALSRPRRSHPHRRFGSSPFRRHSSHLHAAGFEYPKK
jgi:hypothetical protein